MKKLTLDLEELAVDSFETVPGEGGEGSVQAHSDTNYWSCGSVCPTTDTRRLCPP